LSHTCKAILIKTPLDMERIASSLVSELDPGSRVKASPGGFKGLVLVEETSMEPSELARLIEEKIPEAEKVIAAEACVESRIEAIASAAARIAAGRIQPNESFAVRTTRRGKHSFTSIDVNIAAGDAVRKTTGASVNLDYPDKVVVVEIIQDKAYLAVLPGTYFHKKMRPGKKPVYKVFRRISVVHMPYLGPLDAARTMGRRVGREIQTFEVGELVIAPIGLVDAEQLYAFLSGVFEGIESRYAIQKRSYGRSVHKVKVRLQDLYQLVRSRSHEVIIVLEPEGEPVSRLGDEIYRILTSGKRVNVLVGSREGIPSGIYRFADLVVDVAPGITISTDYAAAAGLIAFATLIHDKLGDDT
jgi:tRNA acetyltransferase TAN1